MNKNLIPGIELCRTPTGDYALQIDHTLARLSFTLSPMDAARIVELLYAVAGPDNIMQAIKEARKSGTPPSNKVSLTEI